MVIKYELNCVRKKLILIMSDNTSAKHGQVKVSE